MDRRWSSHVKSRLPRSLALQFPKLQIPTLNAAGHPSTHGENRPMNLSFRMLSTSACQGCRLFSTRGANAWQHAAQAIQTTKHKMFLRELLHLSLYHMDRLKRLNQAKKNDRVIKHPGLQEECNNSKSHQVSVPCQHQYMVAWRTRATT